MVTRNAAARRAVFLDRDGVINRTVIRDGKPYAPASLAELEILPGVDEALVALRNAGFLNVVITNQPDVASGKQTRETVESMHARLMSKLALDGIKVCYHVDADACACRKPKPGLLLEAAERFGIELRSSFVVGDRWRDVGAGQAAGCRVFFLDCGYLEKRPDPPFITVKSLAEATRIILGKGDPANKG